MSENLNLFYNEELVGVLIVQVLLFLSPMDEAQKVGNFKSF